MAQAVATPEVNESLNFEATFKQERMYTTSRKNIFKFYLYHRYGEKVYTKTRPLLKHGTTTSTQPSPSISFTAIPPVVL